MKKIIALALVVVMIISMGTISYAKSRTGSSAAIRRAQTNINSSSKQYGDWKEIAGNWTCAINGKQLRSTWALIYTSKTHSSQWYYFDANGIMLTGWAWITGSDGRTRCYLFNPEKGNTYGALFMDGMTPDYYAVDSTGALSRNGIQIYK